MRRALAVALALGLAHAALVGCECARGDSGEPGEPGVGAGGGAEGAALPMGWVEGVVRLADGAALPGYPQNPVQVPGRDAIPPECTPPRESDRTPVTQAAEGGGLVGLSIVASGEDDTRWPRATEPALHELTIRDCRLTPSLLVTTRGDRVRMSNETDYPFFPELGEGMLQALLRPEPREVRVERGGVRTVQCGFAAPCGRTEVITLYHPVHTVTAESGRFRLEVPAEQDVRITAWHPLFLETGANVRVGRGETRTLELTIAPADVRAPEPEPPAREGPAEDDPDPNVPF
jgi:hypothetical protein